VTAPREASDAGWRVSRDGRSVIRVVKGQTTVIATVAQGTQFDIALMAQAERMYAMLDEVAVDLKRMGKKTDHIDRVIEALREKVPQ
jgi:hypothetical protein